MFKSKSNINTNTGKILSKNGGRKSNFNKSSFTNRVTNSEKAGLIFPVGRVARILRKGKYSERISPKASIYLTAVIQYMTTEVLDLAVKAANENKRKRIIPRHILLAVSNDSELSRFFGDNTISEGGTMPNIHPALLPIMTDKKDK